MFGTLFFTTILLVFNLNVNVIEGGGSESLSYNFYQQSCPQLENIVQAGFRSIALLDPTFSSVILRLMFHDCQVQGCDASILLDSDEINSEKNFAVRKREQIGRLKAQVERSCPGQVSCADILILAGREAVAMSLGPRIAVPLGRRDTTTARTAQDADAAIPEHDLGVDGMLKLFEEKGLSVEESIAFMGAHTLGVTHCRNIVANLGRQGELARGFEWSLSLKCPFGELLKNTTFVQNDPTSLIFDHLYFSNAMRGRGVLPIDAEMPTDPRTAPYVQRFAADQGDFFRAFSSAFVKVTNYGVLTGEQGTIRNQCNTLN